MSGVAVSGVRRWWSRGYLIAAEVVVSVVVALGFAASAYTIDVNPLQRVGQVSAMAELQMRFALAGVLLIAAMMAIHRWGSEHLRTLSVRAGCAAIAGLATGLVAGGIIVALHKTPFGLWAGSGDYAIFVEALHTRDLRNLPSYYPPLFPAALGIWSGLTHQPAAYALQQLQIVGTALFGPAAYLAWRLVLRPPWALAIGTVAMLPFIEPVKPYPQITLVMLIPVLITLLGKLRHAANLNTRTAIRTGIGYGILLGLLFLLYSGWFVWLAPGLLITAAFLFPWRTAWRPALWLTATTAVVFLAVAFVHLRGLLAANGGTSDAYFYFDTCTDPAYIATWFNDRPFDAGPLWPLPGELGGVGLFTVLLAIGTGLALLLGWRRTSVIAIGATITSAWIIRMWLAGAMYETQTVRLWPRTTVVVLYGLLLLTGLGVYYAVEAVRRYLAHTGSARADAGGRRVPVAILLIPVMFLFASAGSATIDKYMPNQRVDSAGWFAWIAQATKQYDTTVCSPYVDHCAGKWPDLPTHCAPGDEPSVEYRSLGREEE